jgi:hypothetical protein
MFPVFSEIPKLNAFEGSTFSREVNDPSSTVGEDAIANNQFLGRFVSVMDDYALDENGITYSQLNRAERAVPKANLDPVMILSTVNMPIGQEIPHQAPGVSACIEDEGQEHHEGQNNLFRQHLRAPVASWVSASLLGTVAGRPSRGNNRDGRFCITIISDLDVLLMDLIAGSVEYGLGSKSLI